MIEKGAKDTKQYIKQSLTSSWTPFCQSKIQQSLHLQDSSASEIGKHMILTTNAALQPC